jgi:GNAT superfamily N-acetyltransferase
VYTAYRDYIPLLGKTPPTFLEDFDSHVELGNLWLLDHNGSIDAMVVLTPSDNHMLLQTMAVDPNLQGQGLGQLLLQFAEYKTLECGFHDLRLYTNSLMTRNVKIYSKWGFRQIGIESYKWGERIHMRKIISRRKRIKYFQADHLIQV